jgi:hypothetical protein
VVYMGDLTTSNSVLRCHVKRQGGRGLDLVPLPL